MWLPAIVLFPDLPFQSNHRERGARRIAAFVLFLRARSHPRLRLIVHRDNAIADR
jgi:hypothetical protein